MQTIRHEYTSNYSSSYSQMKQALSRGHKILVEVGRNAEKKYWYGLTYSGYHYISILGIDLSTDKAFVGNSGSGDSGWFDLSRLVRAQGTALGKGWSGWLEVYR